jgi:hypothetical protein
MEHLITYLRLLDADAEGADWREVARIVLHLDPGGEPDRARQAFESHLSRAKWMTEHGCRQLLPVARPLNSADPELEAVAKFLDLPKSRGADWIEFAGPWSDTGWLHPAFPSPRDIHPIHPRRSPKSRRGFCFVLKQLE